jgi:hypothetical protein
MTQKELAGLSGSEYKLAPALSKSRAQSMLPSWRATHKGGLGFRFFEFSIPSLLRLIQTSCLFENSQSTKVGIAADIQEVSNKCGGCGFVNSRPLEVVTLTVIYIWLDRKLAESC